MPQLESDFCVVSAGYAGLTVAHRVHQAGHSVTVLEAAQSGLRAVNEVLAAD